MRRIRLPIVAIALAGMAGGALVAHAATTTTNRPIYNYDHSSGFVQGEYSAAIRLTGLFSLLGAESHGGVTSSHLFKGGDVAAKAAEPELAGYSSFRAAKADLGSPGPGNVFDHVVEQSQIGRSGFAPQEIHHPFNLNPVSARINQIKANYYSSKQPFTGGLTVRDWLNGQSFRDQYEFGMDALTQIRAGTIK